MIKTIKISEEKARQMYKTASKDIKELLEANFESSILNPNIMDIIKIEEDVYKYSGKKKEDVLPYKNPKTKQEKSLNALAFIYLLCEILNEGWITDFSDSNQYKYYPYFEFKNKKWLFYCSFDLGSFSDGISALAFLKTEELSNYVGNQFLLKYQEYLS